MEWWNRPTHCACACANAPHGRMCTPNNKIDCCLSQLLVHSILSLFVDDKEDMCSSSPITVLDSPVCTGNGGQGTASNPILVDITPTHHTDSPVKVVLGERYRYDIY